MSSRPDLGQILRRQPGPFTDAVLSDPYRDTPDVPGIHVDARRRLSSLIEASGAEGTARMQVITGDPGEGKTHLLAWLRRRSEGSWCSTEALEFLLAPIAPLRTAERPFHHFLQEAVGHLARTLPENRHTDTATDSPLKILLWRALRRIFHLLHTTSRLKGPLAERWQSLTNIQDRFLSTFAADCSQGWAGHEHAFADAALKLRELGNVDREVFRAIAHFPNEDAQAALIDWLGGVSLSPDRAALLGMPLTLDGENEAFRALKTLFHLAALARIPLILAFDQIEGTERLGPEAIGAFFNALSELFHAGGATASLILCQTAVWPSLKGHAQQQVRDRLEENPPIQLRGLTAEEGLMLLEQRLAYFWKNHNVNPPSSLYPFSREFARREIVDGSLRTPRRILRRFRDLLLDPEAIEARSESEIEHAANAMRPIIVQSSPSPREIVQFKLRTLLEEERKRTPRTPEARAEIAFSTLRDTMTTIERTGRVLDGGVRIKEVSKMQIRGNTQASGLRIVVERNGEARGAYVEANNSSHGHSVAAAIKRMRDALVDPKIDNALLIRERGFAIPAKADQILTEVKPRGAVVWLNEDQIASFAAIEGLLNAAAAGDIPVAAEDARELALDEVPESLDFVDRAVAAVYSTNESRATHDNGTNRELCLAVLSYLRQNCAMAPLPRLADDLGAPIERVHAVIEALQSEGTVTIVHDRSRASVVFLAPEAYLESPSHPKGAPPESSVLRIKTGGRR